MSKTVTQCKVVWAWRLVKINNIIDIYIFNI